MYLHSLRNFDVQGVIKWHTILEAILSFYIIVHKNGKYISRCIQNPGFTASMIYIGVNINNYKLKASTFA